MDKQTALYALEFLKRSDLKGAEVEAFLTVLRAINAIANPPSISEQTKDAPNVAKVVKSKE